jgi:tetratricopeptide (TPR) repeat protein
MQNQFTTQSTPPSPRWVFQLEIASVVAATGAAIAAVISQQVLIASLATVPLSASVILNLVNRRQLIMDSSLQTKITLEQQAEDQANHLAEQKLRLDQLTAELRGVERTLAAINISGIQFDSLDAKSFYKRALFHQQKKDFAAAIVDYTKALEINPNHARAIHNRGLAQASLGHKKEGLEDLRNAAKLFFEQGDIPNYQKAKDLSKKLHDLETNSGLKSEDNIALEVLFS